MMTGQNALRILAAALVLSMAGAAGAASPREGGKAGSQKAAQKAASRGDAPREIDGAMLPTETLGPGGKTPRADQARASEPHSLPASK